ncbi:MAG: ribonuclease HII [Proteobacteria bacterium]|nr:MAG: ribonuclease HII [Pseudomonadota bacterium]
MARPPDAAPTQVLGIDEAGRGPVLGPLVLCGVCVGEAGYAALSALGLEDSKAYGAGFKAVARRAELAREICEVAEVAIQIAEPEEIDRFCLQGGLNRLEQLLAARVIEEFGCPGRIIADGARLFAPLAKRYPQLEARDKADADEVSVAAASIIAKDERDRRLERLLDQVGAELGPIRGGGYPNAATARFLRAYAERHGCLPPGLRQSWSWRVLLELREELGIETPRPAKQLGLLGEAP